MARIAYGVSGEGSGHAIRSREVMRFLRALGHEVHVFTDGRGLDVLAHEFPLTPIQGIHFTYEQNTVRVLSTLWKNIVETPVLVEGAIERLPSALRQAANSRLRVGTENVKRIVETTEKFQPDFFITDFEPFTALAAAHLEARLVAVDNIHRLLFQDTHPPLRYRRAWMTAKAVVRLFAPRVDHYLVTTFQTTVTHQSRVTFAPAIIQPRVFAAAPDQGHTVLVYSSFADESLPKILKTLPDDFIVYGFRRDAVDGNVTFKNYSEETFFQDLCRARAVIGTGGFTLMSECLVMQKPYLALPARGQFEQIDNALQFVKQGWGHMADTVTPKSISRFLEALPELKKNLVAYHHPGNGPTLKSLEEIIEQVMM